MAEKVRGEWPYKTFEVALEEQARLPKGRTRANTRVGFTGEHRPPRAGEWYLSGAIAEGYQARTDLSTPFHIGELVYAETVTRWVRASEADG